MMCMRNYRETSRSKHPVYNKETHQEGLNTDLLCGQFSIPDAVRPAVGPILEELNSKLLKDNKFFAFDIAKNFMTNFLYGAFNFGHDFIKGTLNAEYKDFVPADDTKVYEILLSIGFAAVVFKVGLRLMIIIAPFGEF